METQRLPARTIWLVFCLLAGLVTNALLAQTATLRGTVRDAQTGEVLAGANVLVSAVEGETKSTGAVSGKGGAFELKNLVAGDYQVTVSFIGYAKKIISNLQLATGEVRVISVALSPTGVELNPITITASRRPEKVLDAPAAVNLIETGEILANPSLTLVDHLVAMPAVDVAKMGLNANAVVIRGFNDHYPQAVLSLVDNRVTSAPSLRANFFQFIPTTDDDIERIEIVSGPGSALYGSNSGRGVIHTITKSPFGSEGLKANFAVGERDVAIGSFRYAASRNEVFGYKFSAQYYRGNDWEITDPAEPDSIIIGRRSPAGRADEGGLIANRRNFDVENYSGDLRLDFRPAPDWSAIFAAGFTSSTFLGIGQVGAAQASHWKTGYVQGRVTHKKFFAQAYLNQTGAGDTYLLRTGDRIIEKSKLLVGQIQHGFALREKQQFIYGVDAAFTRPNTGATVNGRNEDNDNTNETGVYLQSETQLPANLTVVGALRFDYHDRTKDRFLSPRAALVYKPNPAHTLRATYNRAFSSPVNPTLFADILAASVPAPATLTPIIGPTLFDLRVRGTASPSFHFNFGPDGRAQMVSLYGNLLAQTGAISSPNSYLTPDVNSVWPALRVLALALAPPDQQARLNKVLPAQLSAKVAGAFAIFNPGTFSFDPVDPASVKDIPVIKPNVTSTLEFGYKGVIAQKLLVTLDLYHTRIKDFSGPLTVQNPNVFINPATFVPALVQDMVAAGMRQDSAAAIATNIAASLGGLPIGAISPQEVQSPTDLIFTYRNFGDISVNGVDLGVQYYFSPRWIFGGSYSYVTKDIFPKTVDQPHDIALNAPRHKFSLRAEYRDPARRVNAQLRFRFVDGFPWNSSVYIGVIPTYRLLDLKLGYDLPFSAHTQLTLSVDNALNEKHQEMAGMPKIGRLTVLRLSQSF